jgi:hypothetical protein
LRLLPKDSAKRSGRMELKVEGNRKGHTHKNIL